VSEKPKSPQRAAAAMAARERSRGKNTALQLFAGLSPSYDRVVDFATLFQDRYWKSWVAGRLAGDGEGVTLDIGCGTLLLEERLINRKNRFVGLDLTKGMLEAGRSKGVRNVSLLVNGDAEFLPFPDESFDAVVSCYVAKYVDVSRLSKELGRVSKKGGRVALYDFVRPRGAMAPLLRLYTGGALRIIGSLLALAKKSEAFTFGNLHRIVDGATWDEEMVRRMEEEGFVTTKACRLTGGAVFAYSGKKREDALDNKLATEVPR
jgi:demethylmenaquinone methyltransferase / 2-methoxy-6-polyprenyl-1,4-benzoquinol methylase